MPTENEMKFILRLECEKEIEEISERQLVISQGYLVASKGVSLRVRSASDIDSLSSKYFVTFKYTTTERVVEVENKIDSRDFADLWKVAMNKLFKVRYIVRYSKSQVWEIDFFKDHEDRLYFAMAEHEMPEGQLEPEFIPDFIKNNLIYQVPLIDGRFSSKLLADVRYAKSMMENIKDTMNANPSKDI